VTDYRSLSLWFDQIADQGDALTPRPGLDGNTDVDVCIVGAGFTGLWTAYYLLTYAPQLSVTVLEAEVAGFGASGRNGGWCSALFPVATGALVRRYGLRPALQMRTAMNETLDEIARVLSAEGIDCHWAKGGSIDLARSEVQVDRVRLAVEEDMKRGGVDGYRLLSADQTGTRFKADRTLAAAYTPHCARIQPAMLVRGLAETVERLGGRILEQTRAVDIRPGDGSVHPSVLTRRGVVRARHVIRATEAWTSQLPGYERHVAPVYSLMVATEPLPASFWAEVGLSHGETFSDARHLIIYGQRTADDRLAFGGRGAPYHYGSTIKESFDRSEKVFAGLRQTLVDLLPAVDGYAFTHSWGGPLGITRDWHASVGLDPSTGLGWAGGYVGDGVATTNLAGRTLANLVLNRDSEVTRLPWVGHRSPRWEPEPLRWLGANAGLRLMTAADSEEGLTGRSSLSARLMGPFLGH
jgi:glycine/D-amino acid oxidase-like deaminating enzyme